jgi:hypothetical protein
MTWSSVLPIIVAYMPAILVVLAGMWLNNKRIDDIRTEMHRGFDSLERLCTDGFRGFDARLNLMQADMKDLNKTMTALEIDVALLKDKAGM